MKIGLFLYLDFDFIYYLIQLKKWRPKDELLKSFLKRSSNKMKQSSPNRRQDHKRKSPWQSKSRIRKAINRSWRSDLLPREGESSSSRSKAYCRRKLKARIRLSAAELPSSILANWVCVLLMSKNCLSQRSSATKDFSAKGNTKSQQLNSQRCQRNRVSQQQQEIQLIHWRLEIPMREFLSTRSAASNAMIRFKARNKRCFIMKLKAFQAP